MIHDANGRFYVNLMKGGKRYHLACTGCNTRRAADQFEKELRDVLTAFQKQATDEALKATRLNIRSAADVKDTDVDSSIIVLKVLPIEIVDDLFRERREALKTRREAVSGKKEIALQDAYALYTAMPSKRIPGDRHAQKTQSYWRDFCDFMTAKYPDASALAAVTKAHAEEYIAYLRQYGVFNKGVEYARGGRTIRYDVKTDKLSNATINGHHKYLRTIFKRLAERAGLTSNPFDFDTLDNASAEREVFSAEEIAAIFENATMPYIRPVFTVGLFTGLTLADICLLKWSEIAGDWITDKRRRKTGARLEIPILPMLAALLSEQRSVSGGGEYVFPELAQMYLDNPSGVNYRIREFLQGLGIKSASKVEGRTRAVSTKGAHALRHTFAYIAGMHNIPLAIVQQVLGHLTPEMTRHYESHARREEKERYFRKLSGAFGGQIEATPPPLALPGGSSDRDQARRLLEMLTDSQIKEFLEQYGKAVK